MVYWSHSQAWALLAVVAVSQGVPGTWMAMMVTNLTKVGAGGRCLTEQWLALVALTSRVVLTVATLAIARLTDLLRGHLKTTCLTLLALAFLAYTALTLVSTGLLAPPSLLSLEACVFSLLVLGNCLARSTGPLLQVVYSTVQYSTAQYCTVLGNCLARSTGPLLQVVCSTVIVQYNYCTIIVLHSAALGGVQHNYCTIIVLYSAVLVWTITILSEHL